MKRRSFISSVLAFLLVILLGAPMNVRAEDTVAGNAVGSNKFNVVIATDASNSINYTDPSRLRDDAMEQFIGLLAEQGNTLGGVVFSTGVEASADTTNIDSKEAKDGYVDFFKGAQTYSYTNIGAALEQSISMIETKGNPELPSVIVLLSDGNTEMPTDEELTASLDQKAAAIQKARDKGIKIFTVCLNANSQADITEMQQISEATGGAFEEVKSAEDLKAVFNDFYNLIYGTSTIQLVDDVFPENGVLEQPFTVPGIGVEEVNIVVNGASTGIDLTKPDGTPCGDDQKSVTSEETFSMVKIKNVEPGEWKLAVHGNPGNQVKINMVYNTNLAVAVEGPQDGEAFKDEPSTVKAQLKAGDVTADTAAQYTGYQGALEICDIDGNVLESVPMELGEEGFTVDYQFPEGVSYYRVKVTGNYLEKTSDLIGPLNVTTEKGASEEEAKEAQNTPPTPVEDRVKDVVYVWPFKGGSTEIDMSGLATDKEDKELTYTLVSSSFLEGTDYEVKDNIIKQDHFSLSRGSYTVRATDSGGLTCEIEVEVITRNLGIMALIGIGLIALIVLIIFGILLWIALTKPFGGPVYVQACVNGKYGDKVKKQKARGRIKLSAFNLPSTGMNYSKAYFQATGEPHIFLKTKTPVYYSGRAVTEVRIESGAETTVSLDKEGSKLLYIRYESRLRAKRKGPKPPKGPKEPKRPGGGFGGGMGGGSSRSGKRPGPSRPGTGPAPSRPGSAPSGTGPSKPGSRPGTGPAPSRPGSAPSGTGPSRPGSRPGAGPAPSRPGSAPSGTGPSKPGSRPGAGPAPSRPGSRPTAGPGVRPSARPGSRPGSRPSPRRDKE